MQTQLEFERQDTLQKPGVNTEANLDKARANRDLDRQMSDQQMPTCKPRKSISRTRVLRLHFDGIVTPSGFNSEELAGTGEHVNLASIVQLDPIYVTFNVSEAQDLLKFRSANDRRPSLAEASLQIPIEVGLMNEEELSPSGQDQLRIPEIDPQTATLLVRGRVREQEPGAAPRHVRAAPRANGPA